MVTPTTQLNATEQDTLVKQIGLALLRAAPRDWRRVTAQYRAVGRYHELTGEVLIEDGSVQEWMATHDIATLFGRLRAGMYREGRGTWFNARYQLDHPSSYNLEYDRDEPRWNLAPPPQAYSDELRMFPRSEDNVPEWLMRRMSGLSSDQGAPRFRMARIFDGQDGSGRPVFNRPDLDVDERERLLEYLDSAPVVLSERGFDLDRLAQAPVAKVPVAFRSDGVWIWPAAVNYYLKEHRVAPEGELVAHIRSTGFSLPEVPDQTLQAAAAYLSRTAGPPAPPRPARPMPDQATTVAPAVAPPPAPEPKPEPEPRYEESGFETPAREEPEETPQPVAHATTFTPALPPDFTPPLPDPGPPTLVSPPEPEPAEPEPTIAADAGPGPARAAQPVSDNGSGPTRAVPPAPRPPTDPVLDVLQSKLDELGVPADTYQIGMPAERGWSMEKVDSGWRAGWYDQGLANSAVFGDAADAAAFMLGKLLLDPATRAAAAADFDDATPITGLRSDRPREEPPAPEPPAPAAPSPERPEEPEPIPGEPTMLAQPVTPPPAGEPTMLAQPVPPPPAVTPPPAPRHDALPRRAEPARPAPTAGSGGTGGSGQQQWPIQPLPGEPPLTLFRGKEMRELPPGSELDRFGTPNGNLTYAAGTPFEERSLVPEWVNRPYRVYRVQRPIEALAGVAIPWFNQPGGGAAYLLPASIEELLAEGDLIELDPGEPPIS